MSAGTLTPIQLRGLIMFRTGMKVERFALHHGLSKQSVYNAINGFFVGRSRKHVHEVIASAVGVSVAELWPNFEEDQKGEANE